MLNNNIQPSPVSKSLAKLHKYVINSFLQQTATLDAVMWYVNGYFTKSSYLLISSAELSYATLSGWLHSLPCCQTAAFFPLAIFPIFYRLVEAGSSNRNASFASRHVLFPVVYVLNFLQNARPPPHHLYACTGSCGNEECCHDDSS